MADGDADLRPDPDPFVLELDDRRTAFEPGANTGRRPERFVPGGPESAGVQVLYVEEEAALAVGRVPAGEGDAVEAGAAAALAVQQHAVAAVREQVQPSAHDFTLPNVIPSM